MKRHSADEVVFWSANWWRENPHAIGDFALVENLLPDFVGINEGRKYVRWAKAVDGYTAAVPTQGDMSVNNLALVRDDTLEYLTHWSFKMCDAVGSSPERWATVVACLHSSGALVFVIVTHWNSHVQHGSVPHRLRRVGQYVIHMRRLTRLIRLYRRLGAVVVVGDTNWSWGQGRWPWSPHRVFHNLGMVSQWDSPDAPDQGSHGKGKGRRLDVVAYNPDEWELVDTGYVDGEHSDHRWPWVTLRLITHPARDQRKARR